MTSANVIEFTIRDLQGNEVGRHRQHSYCKTHWEKLLAFTPLKNFTIQSWGYDEDEGYWAGKICSLEDFIENLKTSKKRIKSRQ